MVMEINKELIDGLFDQAQVMVVSTHFRCGKGVKRGLKNGALPFTSCEGV